MQTLNEYIKDNYDGSPTWFQDAVGESWQQSRIRNILNVKEYLSGKHLIKQRQMEYHNNKPFKPAAINMNYAKMITEFQTQFLLKNKLTLSCDDTETLKIIRDIYNKGKYPLFDPKLTNAMIKAGEAYEYVYLDSDGNITSKLFDGADSYPIYNDMGQMIAFIYYYCIEGISYYQVYTPETVTTYDDNGGNLRKTGEYENISGLPIAYIIPSELDELQGVSSIVDYVDILDSMEQIISKYHDAFYKFLQPTPVIKGDPLNLGRDGEAKIDPNVVGYALQLKEDGDMEYLTGKMDYNSLKALYDILKQSLLDVAGLPSVVMAGSEISNISETSIKMLYSLSMIKAAMFEQYLKKGFNDRFEQIAKIQRLKGIELDISDLEVIFEYNLPNNAKEIIDNLKALREINAISLQTLLSRSPYIYDTSQEMALIKKEGNKTGEDE
jgi:SPP1 family phage portal protein